MLTPAIQTRKSLLSLDPQTQEQTAASLGHSAPHRELPLIESALKSDCGDKQHLTTITVKRMLNAAMHHLSTLPLLQPHAQEDIIAKAYDVYESAGVWAMYHFEYSKMMDHIACLREELETLGAYDLMIAEGEVAAW